MGEEYKKIKCVCCGYELISKSKEPKCTKCGSRRFNPISELTAVKSWKKSENKEVEENMAEEKKKEKEKYEESEEDDLEQELWG